MADVADDVVRTYEEEDEEDEEEEEEVADGEIDTQAVLKGAAGDDDDEEEEEELVEAGAFDDAEEEEEEEEEEEGGAAAAKHLSQYEKLAQAKREAAAGRPGKAGKRKRGALTGAEELEEFFTRGERRRRRARGRRGRKASAGPAGLSEEASAKLSEATLLFMRGDFAPAAALLQQVIRLAPGAPDGYASLAALHESMGEGRKALDFKMIAAHLTPRDAAVWRDLAQQSVAAGNSGQAVYCLTRVLRLQPGDPHARWDRSILYSELGELRFAIQGLEVLQRARPADPEVAAALARLYHRSEQPERAASLLEQLLVAHPETASATLVNMLAEVLLRLARYSDALQLLALHAPVTQQPDGSQPVDLAVKEAVCHAYLGGAEAAERALAGLLRCGAEEYADLYLEAANAFWAVGDARRALALLQPLARLPQYDTPALWARLATCLSELGEAAAAAELYEEVLRRHPGDPAAVAGYAELLMAQGRREEAMAQLAALEGLESARLTGGGAGGAGGAGEAEAEEGEEARAEAARRRLRAARLHLAAGDADAFLDMALPLVQQSVRAEVAAVEQAVAAAAAGLGRRGGRRARPPAAAAEAGEAAPGVGDELALVLPRGVFHGFLAKPKRRARSRAAAAAAAQLAAQSATEAAAAAAREAAAQAEAAGGADDAGAEAAAAAAAAAERQLAAAQAAQRAQAAAHSLLLAPAAPPAVPGLLRDDETFAAFSAVVTTLRLAGRLDEAGQLVDGATALSRGGGAAGGAARERLPQIRLLEAELAEARGEWEHAVACLRLLLSAAPGPGAGAAPPATALPQLNAFCRVLSRAGAHAKHAKLLGRLASRQPGCAGLALAHGGACAAEAGGQTAASLAPLFRAFGLAPRQPLACLALGCALQEWGLGGGAAARGEAALAAYALLQRYALLRGWEGESSYNMARALHGCGLGHLAIGWYERALEGSGPLAHEAAHNLARLYAEAGAGELARAVLRRFRTVG